MSGTCARWFSAGLIDRQLQGHQLHEGSLNLVLQLGSSLPQLPHGDVDFRDGESNIVLVIIRLRLLEESDWVPGYLVREANTPSEGNPFDHIVEAIAPRFDGLQPGLKDTFVVEGPFFRLVA